MKCPGVFPLCALFALGIVRVASADPVIFSTLGPGDSYNPNFTFGIYHELQQGQQFRPTADGQLSTLELGLTLFRGADHVAAQLLTDNNGQPGALIESFTFSGIPLNRGHQESALLSAASVLNPFLTTEAFYWVLLTRGDPSTEAGWNASSSRTLATHFIRPGNDPPRIEMNQLAAFRLNAAHPIPEPGTMLLVGSTLAIAAFRHRRRRHELLRSAA